MRRWIIVWVSIGLWLSGCASSNVSRHVENSIDQGVQNANNLYDSGSDGTLANAYQNSSQSTKGAILGGTAGVATGALTAIGALPGMAMGAVFGASYGKYIDANTTLRDQIENRGGNVMVLGDNTRIIMPSARLFNPYSSTINSSAYSTVALIAKYLNQFPTALITVSAYTDDYASPRVSLALSDAEARNLAKLLAAYGVNTRLLYAKGYGGTKLVDTSGLPWGESDNDRIEITFERLHA